MGLFTRVKGGSLPHPGMCAVCGSSYKDALDMGFDFSDPRAPVSRLGAILLCVECFRSAAEVMDYIPNSDATNLIQVAVAEVYEDEAQRVADGLKKAIATYALKSQDALDELRGTVSAISDGNFPDPEPGDADPSPETLDIFDLQDFEPGAESTVEGSGNLERQVSRLAGG